MTNRNFFVTKFVDVIKHLVTNLDSSCVYVFMSVTSVYVERGKVSVT